MPGPASTCALVLALALAAPEPTVDTTPAPEGDASGVVLSVGYYGPYVIQPGLRAGAFIQPLSRVVTPRVGRPRLRTDGLFVAPHLAVFGRAQNHWSLMADTQVGYRGLRHDTRLYSSWALGLAYILELQTQAIRVELGTGSKSRTRAPRHHVVPTLDYEFGQEDVRGRLGWYVHLSAGYRVGNLEGALYLAVGLGLRVRLSGTPAPRTPSPPAARRP